MLTIIAAFAQAESQGASDNANLTVKRKFEAGIPVQDLKYTFGFDTDEGGNTYGLFLTLPRKACGPARLGGT